MGQSLAVRETAEIEPLSAQQVRAQVNLVQEVMKAVMQEGQHFGKIPGCGDKPTLLKPGAEKLMMTFRLAADPQVQEIPTEDGITFRVTCRILSQATGAFLGSGVGECSTKEEKYCWRFAASDKEWGATPEDRKRVKYTKDKEIRQVRTNPADIANTALKMAKKRALVDAVLTVTGASDIFTQDIEDMPEEVVNKNGNGSNAASKASTVKSNNSGSAQPKDPGKPITEGQKKLIYAKSKAKGIKEDDIKAAFGVESVTDLTMGQMNAVIEFIEKGVVPSATGVPDGCTNDATTCEIVLWDGESGKPLCNGKPCPYYDAERAF